jgi:hypothetical protein
VRHAVRRGYLAYACFSSTRAVVAARAALRDAGLSC